jgi:hypothetical protein
MAKVDLHNFFQYYDEKNPNHVKGIQWLEDNLPVTYLEDDADWAEIYRGKKTSATVAPVAVAPPAPVPAWEPAKPPVAPTASKDDFPASGLKLIKEFEGCHLKAYPDPLSGNLPITIGWGTTRKKDGSPFKMFNKKENAMGQLIRVCILGWSAALLTASYAGTLSKMDPTFIATVFTASAATFGINTMKKGGDEEDEKKEEPRREEFVEAPPEPPVEAVEEVATSLVERVEALEGTVTPRT